MANAELLEMYQQRMDRAVNEKFSQLYPYFPDLSEIAQPTIASIGAGTGKLERLIARVIPEARIVALDYALPMIDTINDNSSADTSNEVGHPLIPLLADAQAMPLADNSCDVVLASSVVHEIISFKDHYQVGQATTRFFQEAARVLRPSGRLLLRDFVQPDNPTENVLLQIGTRQTSDDADPADFLARFLAQFKGSDLRYIEAQLSNGHGKLNIKPGRKVVLRAADALEIVVHYAWSQRFEDEVQERYAYFPLHAYARFIQSFFKKANVPTRLVGISSTLQPGYTEHIQGRFSLYRPDGNTYPLPPFTGVIAVEKLP